MSNPILPGFASPTGTRRPPNPISPPTDSWVVLSWSVCTLVCMAALTFSFFSYPCVHKTGKDNDRASNGEPLVGQARRAPCPAATREVMLPHGEDVRIIE